MRFGRTRDLKNPENVPVVDDERTRTIHNTSRFGTYPVTNLLKMHDADSETE